MWALLVSGMFHTTVTEENVLLSLLILSRAVSGRSGALGGPVECLYNYPDTVECSQVCAIPSIMIVVELFALRSVQLIVVGDVKVKVSVDLR